MDKINLVKIFLLYNLFYCTSSQLCDVRQWYQQCVRRGLFDGKLSNEQLTIRDQIETLIMESRTNRRKKNIDCLLLDEYEEMLENKPLETEFENSLPSSETEADETDITDDVETGDSYLNEDDSSHSWQAHTEGNVEMEDTATAPKEETEVKYEENVKIDEKAPDIVQEYDIKSKESVLTETDVGVQEVPSHTDTVKGAKTTEEQIKVMESEKVAVDGSQNVGEANEQAQQNQNEFIEKKPNDEQKENVYTKIDYDHTAPTDNIKYDGEFSSFHNENQREKHPESKAEYIPNTLLEEANNHAKQTTAETNPNNMKITEQLKTEKPLENIKGDEFVFNDEQRQALNNEHDMAGNQYTSEQFFSDTGVQDKTPPPIEDQNSDTNVNIETTTGQFRETNLGDSGSVNDNTATSNPDDTKGEQTKTNMREQIHSKPESKTFDNGYEIKEPYKNFWICSINQCKISDIFNMKYIAPESGALKLDRCEGCKDDIPISKWTAEETLKTESNINDHYKGTTNDQNIDDQTVSTGDNGIVHADSDLSGNNIVNYYNDIQNKPHTADLENEDSSSSYTDVRHQPELQQTNVGTHEPELQQTNVGTYEPELQQTNVGTNEPELQQTNVETYESLEEAESKTGDLVDKFNDFSETPDMIENNNKQEKLIKSHELGGLNELPSMNVENYNKIETDKPLYNTKPQQYTPPKEENGQHFESFPSPGMPLTTTEDKELKTEGRKEERVDFRNEYKTLKSQVEQDKQNIILKIDNMLQSKTHEYSSKIQNLEILIMKLENQLLTEKFDKHNHSSTIIRLESSILKLENELLKLNQSHNDLKMENEYLNKKRTSYLELDHVPVNTSNKEQLKNTELISEQQNKIFQLKELLKNQSKAIHHFRSKFEYLEDQNRMLFQMVMNQTSLMTQIMSRVQELSDQNMQHRVEAQMLKEKLALTKMSDEKEFQELTKVSSKLMDKLDAIVSVNKLDMTNNESPNTSITKNRDSKTEMIGESEKQLKENIWKTKQLANATQNWCGGHNMICVYKSVRLSTCVPFVPVFWSVCEAAINVDTLPKLEYVYDKRPNVKTSKQKNGKRDQQSENKNEKIEDTKEGAFVQENAHIVQVPSQDVTLETRDNENTDKQHVDGNNQNDKKTLEQPQIEEADTMPKRHIDTKQIEQGSIENTVQEKTLQDAAEDNKDNEETKNKEHIPVKITDNESKTPEKQTSDKTIGPKDNTEEHRSDKILDKNNNVNDVTSAKKEQVKPEQAVQDSQKSKNAKSAPEPKASEGPLKERLKEKPVDKTHKRQNSQTEAVDKKKPSVKQGNSSDNIKNRKLLYEKGTNTDPKDCYDHLQLGNKKNSMYKIKPYGLKKTIQVRCDMRNGGWTVIQQRSDGTTKFFRDWNEYKSGFGGVFGEHWLGNDYIHYLTNQDNYELRIELTDWNKTKKYAQYKHFSIDDEKEGYKLTIDGYSGSAGDGMAKHNGHKFSTKDVDNDKVEKEFGGSCAKRFSGAWWYYKCYMSNLNGIYYRNGQIPPKLFDGITWKPWTGPNYSLRSVEMKIRPVSANEK